MQINAPTTKAAVAPNFEYRPKDKILQAKSFAVRHLRTTADMIKTSRHFYGGYAPALWCENPQQEKTSDWQIYFTRSFVFS